MSYTPRCTECRRPVVARQGNRHLSCSPVCVRCHQPIASDMPFEPVATEDGMGQAHSHCPGTRNKKKGAS